MLSNSSLVFWRQKQILPRGIFLTSSGSGGDRLLFWQSAPHIRQAELTRYQTAGSGGHVKTNTKDKDLAVGTTDSAEVGTNQPGCTPDAIDSAYQNPFAMKLISDRPDHLTDVTTSPTGSVPVTDRLGNTSGGGGGVSGSSVVGGPLSVAANLSTGAPSSSSAIIGSTIGAGPCGPFSVTNGITPSDSEHAWCRNVVIGPNGLSTIDGISTNILLGLLHQQTQELQRKIYVKLENHIYVGAAFNATGPTDLDDLDLEAESHSLQNCCAGHSLISFAVVFAMDTAAPPSLLSYYTELARLTGAQIRRAELVFHYLSHQRNIIITTVDRTSPGFGYGEDIGSSDPPDTDPGHVDLAPIRSHHSSKRSQRSGCAVTTSDSPGAPAIQSAAQTPDDDAEDRTLGKSGGRTKPVGEFSGETILDQLVRLSTLCSELKTIIDSVCLTGHVSVKINNLYPIYFCLPHKAYSLVREPSPAPVPAIRPMAIWRAMDHIRPYHALLLLLRKEDLLQHYIPPDINTTMFDFVKDLSPTLSLHSMSVRMHSQLLCLSLALWLIYRGHALIVYPIVANNTYVLSPHSTAWFRPQLIAQFARMFPTVNLAALLASFSTGLTLKDFTPVENGKISESTSRTSGPSISQTNRVDVDGDETEQFWTNLSYAHKVELITWLLRRRLIIQIHIYVFSTLVPPDAKRILSEPSYPPSKPDSVASSDLLNRPTAISVSDGLNMDNPSLSSLGIDMDQLNLKGAVPNDLFTELCHLFPKPYRVAAVRTVLTHPGATQNLALLRLFCHIYPRLPAHLEELMFVESVDRITLVDCVERFNPILTTARLPDPVTACFAGVDWPD